MKNKGLFIRISEKDLSEIKDISESSNISQSELISKMLDVYKKQDTKLIASDITDSISKAEISFKKTEQRRRLTPAESSFKTALKKCFNILSAEHLYNE